MRHARAALARGGIAAPRSGAALHELTRGRGRAPLGCSAISFWEIERLCRRGSVDLGGDTPAFRRALLERGFREIAVDGEIGIAAIGLDLAIRDPADQIIAATTLKRRATLVTADAALLDWARVSGRRVIDAGA